MTGRTIVFDLDGTLVDSAPDIINGLNVSLALENIDPVTPLELRSLIGGGVRLLLSRGLKLRKHEVSEPRFEELVATFLSHYELHIADETTLYPDVIAVLDRLAADGNRLAICTNKPIKLTHLLLDALNIRDRFAAVTGADTFPVRKPDAAHLTGTIELAKGNPANAIMIGDSKTDLDTARNAGLPIVLMDYGYTEIPASELGPDRLLSNFRDVPGAIDDLLGAAVSR
ncbi:HAD-IA family hydrolase [Flaviflagellibacter deserti]|uniref:Phosphoglycolate phosphatase n=1 Tax=Flaviflagellibacter deserti TaxID=2267266 RepID=A0ABV9Z263_9HYPH